MQKDFINLNSIDLEIPEGKLLQAAICIITTESQRDKTPDEVLHKIQNLALEMEKEKAKDMQEVLDFHQKERDKVIDRITKWGYSAHRNSDSREIVCLANEYAQIIRELLRLQEVAAIEPKQPSGFVNQGAQEPIINEHHTDIWNHNPIDIRSLHDKEPLRDPESYCYISKLCLEHLLNCLDNQKAGAHSCGSASQIAIDRANRAARIMFNDVMKRERPRVDFDMPKQQNGAEKNPADIKMVFTQQALEALLKIRDKAKQFLREMDDGGNKSAVNAKNIGELNTALWEYHAAGGGL